MERQPGGNEHDRHAFHQFSVLHYYFEYYVTPGHWSFCSKVVVGWVGAWLGSPVFGYWPHKIPILHYEDVWFIPAILGALALIIVAVDVATIDSDAQRRGS